MYSVNVANRDGIVSEGFGSVRIRAGEGRSVQIEITDDLSGMTVVAVLDEGRGRRSRVNLQVDELVHAVESAAREDGVPGVMPTPR